MTKFSRYVLLCLVATYVYSAVAIPTSTVDTESLREQYNDLTVKYKRLEVMLSTFKNQCLETVKHYSSLYQTSSRWLEICQRTTTPPKTTTPATSPVKCPKNTFECPSNNNQYCLPVYWQCDGVQDCDNGIDEANCAS